MVPAMVPFSQMGKRIQEVFVNLSGKRLIWGREKCSLLFKFLWFSWVSCSAEYRVAVGCFAENCWCSKECMSFCLNLYVSTESQNLFRMIVMLCLVLSLILYIYIYIYIYLYIFMFMFVIMILQAKIITILYDHSVYHHCQWHLIFIFLSYHMSLYESFMVCCWPLKIQIFLLIGMLFISPSHCY